jgi:ABC-type transport system involved in cytochrome bd biosynthesis fused ATPase/permease subunit
MALRGEPTVISITHRTAILGIADQVYELAEGRVVATDKYRAL